VAGSRGQLYVFDAGDHRVIRFTGDPAAASYAADGSGIYSSQGDAPPETGGVVTDRSGDVFFDNNDDSAVIYENIAG